ncbi:hypothetical protein N790_02270 [Arenimonas malthae CC-JY-1]|uniref:Phosphate-specific transport system accessory protein PhoU n=1 Tax=Arenimonas malthae CC-JY-1 TaxID=1384054 RepID=A0A091BMC1_9GAMM|nr:hypothetical protein N790_02270 [Arenimonas malthae CC-JY-1]
MTTHIVQAFDLELRAITEQVGDLGRRVGEQVANAVRALDLSDALLADEVRAGDEALDRDAERIENDAINLIARRQPLAVDLRHVMAALRIAANLERAGDLASNIAKRAIAVMPSRLPEGMLVGLHRMVELALSQLRDSLEAFGAQDAALAQQVLAQDATLDELHTALFRDIVQHMSAPGAKTLDMVHLLFVAKNIERIGDHATNIAENVVYLVSGPDNVPDRAKNDESSLLATLLPREAE